MKSRIWGIGIIGCGLIGLKRSQTLGTRGKLLACADVNEVRAEAVAAPHGAVSMVDWHKLLDLKEIDVVVVATPHDSLAEITRAAVLAGKHVLVEKPAARNVTELDPVIEAVRLAGVCVRVGFNHRYHRAFRKVRELLNTSEIGQLMFLRARYGHGGRLGYDREWRADPRLSGGGELIDQGPHLIDLSRWILGDLQLYSGFAHTYYWDMPVDDNAFMLLKGPGQVAAHLHVSCTEWRNQFSMEIYGRNGKLDISGLGGSYGIEKLTWYRMLPEMGPPETIAWEYPMADDSWAVEMQAFYDDIETSRKPDPGLDEARATLNIIEKIYEESAK